MVKGKEGNECMGVGESAPYSLDCQFTSKLPLSPPDQPDPFEKLLLWLQSAYENTTADRVGVRVARRRCVQRKHTELSLSDTMPLA